MNYDKIILELMDRLKITEEKVKKLEVYCFGNKNIINLTDEVRNYIRSAKEMAKSNGDKFIVLVCNDIQKVFGVTNRARSICMAMYDCMNDKDEILFAPPSKTSTTVKIKYYL